MDVNGLQSAAVEYAELGWQVFPLQVKSKAPRGKKDGWGEWQKKTSSDPEVVEEFWEKYPGSNIAVRLGADSGIIDIEVDSKEGEDWLIKMFGGPENVPVTPTFVSSTKSGTPGKHRLFRCNSELPHEDKGHWRPRDLAGTVLAEVDFKVGGGDKGTYSVFPPSVHPDTGETYKWLITPDECEPAELPDQFVANVFAEIYGEGIDPEEARGKAKPKEYWSEIISGVTEGGRNQSAAELIGFCMNSLADPFNATAVAAQFELVNAWNIAKNKPPLPDVELKRTFESILKTHRANWTREQEEKGMNEYVDRDPETGTASKAPWRLVKVLSEPIRWKLYSPLWASKAPGGFIWLTTGELRSATALGLQALEQAGVWLDTKFFPSVWNGTKKGDAESKRGLAHRLVENCETEEASVEEKRSYFIADLIHNLVCRTEYMEGYDEPDPRGKMVRRQDGSVWFQVNHLLSNLQHIADPVKMGELTSLLKKIGVGDRQARIEGRKSPIRFKVFTNEAQAVLQDMSLHSPEGAPEEDEIEECSAKGGFKGATTKDEELQGFM